MMNTLMLGENHRGIMAMVLAGGEGKRLMPLTSDRAKPAVPFGGVYRLIDFAISNLVNGGMRKIVVLTQYKSHSLDRHIAQAWSLSSMLGDYVATVPAQMRRGPRWFSGSADAIYQNVNLIHDERPAHVCVFGADHIYRMDPRQMLNFHLAAGAGLTLAGIRVPLETASAFGVIETDGHDRVSAFREKPADPRPLPDAPGYAYASMGIYLFDARVLLEAVSKDAEDAHSKHDVGGSIVPMLVDRGQAAVYDFQTNQVPGVCGPERGYWRDVGDLDSYYEASMDLIMPQPAFNLYNRDWPISSWHEPRPPAKFVFDDDSRRGQAVDSLVSAGSIISGGTVRRSVVSPDVTVREGALVEASVLMDGVDVGPGSVVRHAILDKNVVVPPGVSIGTDSSSSDESRLHRSPRGVVAVAKGQAVPQAGT
jgi:glucose-1-phosphate adenylyltransferase